MILLLDEDETFRTGLAECLIDDGHAVCAYSSPRALPDLGVLGNLRAAVVDYQLEGENGLSFADRLNRARPHIPIVLATAVPQLHLESAAKKRRFLSLLRKPFQYETLVELLHLGKTRR
jgi:FixJ family two-component response regulator